MNALAKLIIGIAWPLFYISQTAACSVPSSYIRPTNFELVYQTPAIVLAAAVSFRKEQSGRVQNRDVEFGKFTFKILERMKGDFALETLVQEGDTINLSWGP